MKKRGFNIVEYSIVIVLIVLVATIVIPRLSTLRAGQEAVGFRLSLSNLALAAREYSVNNQATTRLSFDGQNNVVWQTIEEETNEDGTAISTDEAERRQENRQAAVPSGVQFNVFQRFGQSVIQSDWRCDFFPDGTSDRALLEFEQNGRSFVFEVKPDRGLPDLYEGRLNDRPVDTWDAGELETRG